MIAFVAAWAVSRLSKRLAEWMVGRYEVKHFDQTTASTDVILGLKRRETIVSLVQSTVRYAAYGDRRGAHASCSWRGPAAAARWPARRSSSC